MALLTNINGKFSVSDAGAVTFNNAFTFPTADGTANYVLQTNGSGQLAWAVNGNGDITGSGTANTVTKFTGAKTIGDGPITFSSNDSTFAGDVGIGVAATKALQVSGEALFGNGTDGLLLSYSGGNSSGIIDTGHSSTALEFRVGNTQELLINGSSATFTGNVGIGAAPSHTLDVKGADTNNATIARFYSNIGTRGSFVINNGTGVSPTAFIGTAGGSEQLSIGTNSTEAIRIDGSQRVGIGTTSPDVKLDVRGEIAVAYNATYGLRFYNDARNNWSSIGNTITGSSSANLVFKDATGEVMRIATGNVGIGTTSPDQTGYGYKTLTIMGGTTAGYAGVLELLTPSTNANGQNLGIVSFGSGGTRNALIGAVRQSGNNNAKLQFWTAAGANGIENRMTIDADGQVGIGTDSPLVRLQLERTVSDSTSRTAPVNLIYLTSEHPSVGYTGFGTAITHYSRTYQNSTKTEQSKIAFTQQGDSVSTAGSTIDFYTKTLSTGSAAPEFRMRINYNGNVGIGTSTPTTRLHVSSANSVVTIEATTNGQNCSTWYKANGNNQWETGCNIGAGTDYQIYDRLNSASRMVVGHDGDVTIPGKIGIGTTNPTYKCVISNNGAEGLELAPGYVSGANLLQNYNRSNSQYVRADYVASTHQWYQGDTSTVNVHMDLTGSGVLTVKNDIVAYGSPSDKRLKENIKPIESALDKVSKLQGVTFDWKKSDSILKIKQDIGFIAQDVQKVVPELVRENENGMLSMRHQGIAPILLEAIKELKAEIEELKKYKCDCKK